MQEFVVRFLNPGETGLFMSFPGQTIAGAGVESRRSYRDFVASGQYRPEWSWVAIRDGGVIARCAFWGVPDAPRPYSLDWLEPGDEPDRLEVGATMLRTALEQMSGPDGQRPEYHLFLPPGWRDDPAVNAAANDRLTVAERAGYRPFIERFTYRWTPADGLPVRSTRLAFREASDEQVVDVIARCSQNTLDGYTRRDVDRLGAEGAAREWLASLSEYPSPRDWWRLAYTAAGELVGLIVPSRNQAIAIVGFVAVLPEMRGNGYADDLLAEITWTLAEAGADTIGADTDLGNRPMAAAFGRAGYRNTAIRVVLA